MRVLSSPLLPFSTPAPKHQGFFFFRLFLQDDPTPAVLGHVRCFFFCPHPSCCSIKISPHPFFIFPQLCFFPFLFPRDLTLPPARVYLNCAPPCNLVSASYFLLPTKLGTTVCDAGVGCLALPALIFFTAFFCSHLPLLLLSCVPSSPFCPCKEAIDSNLSASFLPPADHRFLF